MPDRSPDTTTSGTDASGKPIVIEKFLDENGRPVKFFVNGKPATPDEAMVALANLRGDITESWPVS